MKPKTMDFTRLNMFLRCGEQFRRRYIEGDKIPPPAYMFRGRVCHEAEAINFTSKIKSGEYLPVDEVIQLYVDLWNQGEHQIGWTEEDLEGNSPKVAAGKVKDSGVRLIKVFHENQLPHCDPVEVESEFVVNFEGGYPPMVGRFDRIDSGKVIAETKFVKKTPPAGDITTDVQLTAYDLGFRQKFGTKPSQLKKQWAVDTTKPKAIVQTCQPRQDEQINRFLRRLESAISAIEKGNFLPAPNGVWWCSEKYCGYWASCKVKP